MLFVAQVLLVKKNIQRFGLRAFTWLTKWYRYWNCTRRRIFTRFSMQTDPSQALRVEFTEALIFRAILLHSINASVAMLKQQNGFQCLAFMYIGNDVLNRGTRLMLVYYTAQFLLLTFSTSFSFFFFAYPSPTSFRSVHYYWRNGMGSALNVLSEKHKFAKAKE